MAVQTTSEMAVVAHGIDWSISSRRGPYANWNNFGKGVDPVATSLKLGDMIVARFHGIARENGSRARWLPQRGCVVAPDNEALSELDYVMWREQASGEVIDSWLRGRIEPVLFAETSAREDIAYPRMAA